MGATYKDSLRVAYPPSQVADISISLDDFRSQFETKPERC